MDGTSNREDVPASDDGANTTISTFSSDGTTETTSATAAASDIEVRHEAQQDANSEVSDEHQQAGGQRDQQAVPSSQTISGMDLQGASAALDSTPLDLTQDSARVHTTDIEQTQNSDSHQDLFDQYVTLTDEQLEALAMQGVFLDTDVDEGLAFAHAIRQAGLDSLSGVDMEELAKYLETVKGRRLPGERPPGASAASDVAVRDESIPSLQTDEKHNDKLNEPFSSSAQDDRQQSTHESAHEPVPKVVLQRIQPGRPGKYKALPAGCFTTHQSTKTMPATTSDSESRDVPQDTDESSHDEAASSPASSTQDTQDTQDDRASKPGWSPLPHSPVHDTDSLRDDSEHSVQDFACQTSICEPLDTSQLSLDDSQDSDAQALAVASPVGTPLPGDSLSSPYRDLISLLRRIRASGEAQSLEGAISAVANRMQQQPQSQISVNITNNVSIETPASQSENRDFMSTLNQAMAEGPLTQDKIEELLSMARDRAELTHKVAEGLGREQEATGNSRADLKDFAQRVQDVIDENVKAGKGSKKSKMYAKGSPSSNQPVDLSHIINPHGEDNPVRGVLEAIQPPAEQFVCMAQEAAEKVKKNIKIPLYEPDMNPIEWWDTYDSFCDIQGYSVENKRNYLPFHLGKAGAKWFHRSGIGKLKLKVNPTDKEDTIQFVREAFLEKFGVKEPDMYTYKRHLYEMVQGRDTCEEFTEKVIDAFRNLFKCPAGEPLTTDQFVDVRSVVTGGVKPRARDHILIKNPTNADELLAAATTAGHMDKEYKNDYAASIRQELIPEIQKVIEPMNKEIKALRQETKPAKQSEVKKAKTDLNDLMSSISEIKDDMKQIKRTKSQTPIAAKGTCFNCGLEGHIKRHCPSLPRSVPSRFRRAAPYYEQSGPMAHDGGGSGNIRQGPYNNQNRSRRLNNRANGNQLQTCQWCQRQGHIVAKCYLLKEHLAILRGNGLLNAEQNANQAQSNGAARGPGAQQAH